MTDNSNIDVIQLNLNKAYNAGIDLLGKIIKAKCFMALIQEPYSYKGTLTAIPGRSDAIPSTRTGGHFCDKRLKVRELTNLCTKDLAARVCVIGNKRTMILRAYLGITRAVRYEALIKALE